MAIYVDNECIGWRGKQWCHLVADSLAELHVFASALGLKRAWFQEHASYPHYDVTVSVRARALLLGALPADRVMLLTICKKLRAELMAGKVKASASLPATSAGGSPWVASPSSLLP